MTALAGFWRFNGGSTSAECAAMLTAQAVFGPHGTALVTMDRLAMGRAMFQILPEDRHDRQPLSGARGRFLLVADVRLDNRDELAECLGLSPQEARARSDADMLLSAWERWEDATFERLLGDYAFAVWDSLKGRLILARDPLGSRPLHYHRGADFIAFASMPKGLHCLPRVPVWPDEDSVARLLAVVPKRGDRSYFKDVACVEPGHAVELTELREHKTQHWSPRREKLQLANASAYADALREQFDRAVGARLRGAGGTVAAHLSGGRDSGAVAATAARLLSPSGGSVVGFTAVPREGYDAPDPYGRFGNEGPIAAQTAALHPNMEHVLVRSSERGFLEGFEHAFNLYERPLFNPCNQLWFDAINDEAHNRGLKVLLTGQMGNMTISYSGEEWLTELAGNGKWIRLYSECAALVREGRTSWRSVMAGSLGPWIPTMLRSAFRLARARSATLPRRHSALTQNRWAALDVDRSYEKHVGLAASPSGRDTWETRLAVIRRLDVANYSKGVLATWGVDMRDPTCDRRLIEFCLSVPPEHFLMRGQPAALACKAFADRLPPSILEGKRKGVQSIDWHEALNASRHDLGAEVARILEVPEAARTLDMPRLTRLVSHWPNENWSQADTVIDYRMALLRGVAGGHFLRRAIQGNA